MSFKHIKLLFFNNLRSLAVLIQPIQTCIFVNFNNTMPLLKIEIYTVQKFPMGSIPHSLHLVQAQKWHNDKKETYWRLEQNSYFFLWANWRSLIIHHLSRREKKMGSMFSAFLDTAKKQNSWECKSVRSIANRATGGPGKWWGSWCG